MIITHYSAVRGTPQNWRKEIYAQLITTIAFLRSSFCLFCSPVLSACVLSAEISLLSEFRFNSFTKTKHNATNSKSSISHQIVIECDNKNSAAAGPFHILMYLRNIISQSQWGPWETQLCCCFHTRRYWHNHKLYLTKCTLGNKQH